MHLAFRKSKILTLLVNGKRCKALSFAQGSTLLTLTDPKTKIRLIDDQYYIDGQLVNVLIKKETISFSCKHPTLPATVYVNKNERHTTEEGVQYYCDIHSKGEIYIAKWLKPRYRSEDFKFITINETLKVYKGELEITPLRAERNNAVVAFKKVNSLKNPFGPLTASLENNLKIKYRLILLNLFHH